jgi:hypothetical protein
VSGPVKVSNPSVYRVCSGIRCEHYHALRKTGVCCGEHTEPLSSQINLVVPEVTMTLHAAFDLASRKARYGHKEWIVWKNIDGSGSAGLCCAENIRKALDCLENRGRFWRISATSSQGTIIRRRMGELMLRNCLRGQDGPDVRY